MSHYKTDNNKSLTISNTGESRYLEVHGTVAKFRVIRNST